MKQTVKNIDYTHLTDVTGDPFADAGGFALAEFARHFEDYDILGLIAQATEIYVDSWNAKLNTFFLNSKITQPSYDSQQKKDETIRYFKALISDKLPFETGYCRITGQYTRLFPAGRDNTVLTGSGKFVNFHPVFQDGILLSKEAIIRMFFLPLGSNLVQGRVAVIHSNVAELSRFFSTQCCRENLKAVAANLSDGLLHSSSNSTGTAIFRFMDDVYREKSVIAEGREVFLSLYLFSNFGASPDVSIYTLPCEVFDFYRFVKLYGSQWTEFVASHYSNPEYKKYQYENGKSAFVYANKQEYVEVREDVFKYWRNDIYDNLIRGRPIVKALLKYSIDSVLDWDIIREYEIKIRKMKAETIAKIKQMAEYILSANDEDGIKKAITKLNGVKNAYFLRRFILRDIVAKYYNEKNREAIVTIEDYADYLFPDTASWAEMRDVLLIAIYQALHERNISVEIELPEDSEDDAKE